MEKSSYHNVFAVFAGVLMIATGCLIAYFSQKNLFGKITRSYEERKIKKKFE